MIRLSFDHAPLEAIFFNFVHAGASSQIAKEWKVANDSRR